MNRIEFMDQLKDLLREISAEEREEALQYYEDYFADAGEEHEAEVIRELGSPQKVAATIKADLKCGSTDAGLFTECGYEDERFTAKAMPAKRSAGDEKQESTQESESGYRYNRGTEAERNGQEKNGYSYRNPDPQEQKKPATSLGLKILLIILIILIGIPVVIPLGIALICLVISLVIAAYAFFAGLVLGAVGVLIAGIAVTVIGVMLFTVAVPAALLTTGTGVLVTVVGLIGTAATVKLCIVMYPAMFRMVVNICRMPFHRRKVVS